MVSTNFLNFCNLEDSPVVSNPQVPNLYLIPSTVRHVDQNTDLEVSPKPYNTMLTDLSHSILDGNSPPSNN